MSTRWADRGRYPATWKRSSTRSPRRFAPNSRPFKTPTTGKGQCREPRSEFSACGSKAFKAFAAPQSLEMGRSRLRVRQERLSASRASLRRSVGAYSGWLIDRRWRGPQRLLSGRRVQGRAGVGGAGRTVDGPAPLASGLGPLRSHYSGSKQAPPCRSPKSSHISPASDRVKVHTSFLLRSSRPHRRLQADITDFDKVLYSYLQIEDVPDLLGRLEGVLEEQAEIDRQLAGKGR